MSETLVKSNSIKAVKAFKAIKAVKVKPIVDKYNGFKVPLKTRVVTKWTVYIYNMIKEAKPELLENEAVKIAYNNLVACLIKYEGQHLETWIPSSYQKYVIGIKPGTSSYGYSESLPIRWDYTWRQYEDPIIKDLIKNNSYDIIHTYMVLYELIKRDVVHYMETKLWESTSRHHIEKYHQYMERFENNIKVWERNIELHRKSIADYAAKCIILQTSPTLTKFD